MVKVMQIGPLSTQEIKGGTLKDGDGLDREVRAKAINVASTLKARLEGSEQVFFPTVRVSDIRTEMFASRLDEVGAVIGYLPPDPADAKAYLTWLAEQTRGRNFPVLLMWVHDSISPPAEVIDRLPSKFTAMTWGSAGNELAELARAMSLQLPVPAAPSPQKGRRTRAVAAA